MLNTIQSMHIQVLLLFIEGLQPSQPHRVTSELLTISNLTDVECNTKHAHLGVCVCVWVGGGIAGLLLLFIEGLQPSQQHRLTSGLFTTSNLADVEYNTKHAHFTKVKHININRKLVPSVLLSQNLMANTVRRCWYH